MSGTRVTLSLLFAVLLVALCFPTGCSEEKKPVRLGLVGGLSGENVDLGQAGRNGALLALEEINRAGGVNGRPVELLIRDDKNRRESAMAAAQELIDEEVTAIVGPFTTTMTEAVRTVTEPQGMLVFSPTASSVRLSGLDDNLFRLCSTTKDQAGFYAEFMAERGLRRISMIASKDNLSFVKSWVDEYKQKFGAYGGKVVQEVWYDSRSVKGFGELVRELLAPEPDAVLFIANAVAVARMAQQLRKVDATTPMFASEWAATQQVIELGGKAVNGLIVLHLFDKFGRGKRFLRFTEEYRRQFKNDPGFSGIIAYEVVHALGKALKNREQGQSLKEAILANNPYQGLQQTLVIDEYGDTTRQAHFVVVDGMQFIPVKK